MADTRAGWGGYFFRLLPSASADVRGHPRHVWAEDGRWKLGNYEEKQRKIGLNGRNQGGMGEILLPSASVSFRGRPWTSAACVDGRWKMEAVKLWGKTEKNWPKWRKLGRGGRNIAAVRFRGHPRHVWTEDGRWKMGNYEEKQRKFGLNGWN